MSPSPLTPNGKCHGPECEKATPGKKVFCSDRCRQRYHRSGTSETKIRYTAQKITDEEIAANIERIGQRNDGRIPPNGDVFYRIASHGDGRIRATKTA